MINQISCEELRCAVVAQSSRGLRHSAKWIAELYVEVSRYQKNAGISTASTTKNSFMRFGTSMDEDIPEMLMAKTYFDLGEYNRAAFVLRDCTNIQHASSPSPSSFNQKAFFLRGYARYLQGEKEKDQLIAEAVDPLERCKIANEQLQPLQEELAPIYKQGNLDAFGIYLYAMVLNALKATDEAREALIQAVNAYPYIWSAWVDLALLCRNKADLGALRGDLQDHWMKMFFATHALIELRVQDDAIKTCLALMQTIPCTHGKAQLAMARYNAQKYDAAEQLFNEVFEGDPYRLDSLDSFSNILFVKADSARLSRLAHRAVTIDKYRPETCCVVGNYYSLKGNHVKAVKYFKRALRVDRSFLSAWTLLGHEYIELRQHEAAIDAYRQAVDVNPHDYRAWHGLGQTYEFIQMYTYALHYYQKAYMLRPFDARLSRSLGTCYKDLGELKSAIKCFTRALQVNDDPDEGSRLRRAIADLHETCARGATTESDRRFHLSSAAKMYQQLLAETSSSQDALTKSQRQHWQMFVTRYHQQNQMEHSEERTPPSLK